MSPLFNHTHTRQRIFPNVKSTVSVKVRHTRHLFDRSYLIYFFSNLLSDYKETEDISSQLFFPSLNSFPLLPPSSTVRVKKKKICATKKLAITPFATIPSQPGSAVSHRILVPSIWARPPSTLSRHRSRHIAIGVRPTLTNTGFPSPRQWRINGVRIIIMGMTGVRASISIGPRRNHYHQKCHCRRHRCCRGI